MLYVKLAYLFIPLFYGAV